VSSSKGITLEQGQVVILDIDGSLVYVESINPICAAVVALPEQPPTRTDDRVFTPGRVGAKKISSYAQGTVVPVTDLSARNREFIGTYEVLRQTHGVHYVDQTPEELAAAAAKATPVKSEKAERRAERSAERAAKKAERDQRKADKAKLKTTPRYLLKCAVCGQQPGHPDHATGKTPEELAELGKHEFAQPTAMPADEPDEPDEPTTPKAPRAPKPPKAPRAAKSSLPAGPFAFIGDEAALNMLASVNPKYKDGNSGRAIADAIGGGAGTVVDVLAVLAQHPRWSAVPQERVEFAFGQLLGAGLIKVQP
jgi:hypothetical protein